MENLHNNYIFGKGWNFDSQIIMNYWVYPILFINLLQPSDVWTLDQVMAWHLFGAKPLPEPMLTDCQFDPVVQS